MNRPQWALAAKCIPILGVGLLILGCESTATDDADGGRPDAGPTCPSQLPELEVRCDDPACMATTGDRRVAEVLVPAGRWFAVVNASSEFVDDDITVDYGLEISGALLAEGEATRTTGQWLASAPPGVRSRAEARSRAVTVESALRADQRRIPIARRGVLGGTILRPIRRPGEAKQATSCSLDSPDCGTDAVCLIEPGQADGACESELIFGLRNGIPHDTTAPALSVETRVRTVRGGVAILTDLQDSVADEDVQEVAERFTDHIEPLDHTFFGIPVDDAGRDFDGNGVVMIVLTEQVADVSPDIVGFFDSINFLGPDEIDQLQPDDTTRDIANGADLLFMRPPGPSISLDQLSGTVGHEYQHLINYFTKVVRRGLPPLEQERLWVDEGLSSFAEDMLGYGEDAFLNIALYLDAVPITKLVEESMDSPEMRGYAHLLIRYLFERSGGATFQSPGAVTDFGGVGAVRQLVDSDRTGVDHFTEALTGRSFAEWSSDLLVTVALDGTDIGDVSCNPGFQFQDPETDSFTGFQRGIDLRSSIPGTSIQLFGPTTDPFAAADDLPFTGNGGEIRTLDLSTPGSVSLTTDVVNAEDFDFGFRVIPAN